MLSTERSFSSEAKIETTFLTFNSLVMLVIALLVTIITLKLLTKMTSFFPPLSENYSVNLTRVNSAVRRLQLRFTKNGIDTVLLRKSAVISLI